MLRVILRNVFANWAGFAVNVMVMFFLTPFVLRSLGEVRYGVWVLTMSIVGYYGLLDFGLRVGVTQYLTRYRAREQYEEMNATISSAVAMLTAIGVLLAVLGLPIAFFAPEIFDVETELHQEVFWCILIISISVAFQFALFPFSAVFAATQRFDLSNLIGVATRLASAIAIWMALERGYGLLGLTVVTAVSNIVDYVIRWRVSFRILPQLHFSWELVDKERAKEQLLFGGWNFLISINFVILVYMDAILIGLFLQVAAVTIYALAANLAQYLGRALRVARGVFHPAATELHAQEDVEGLKSILFLGSRFLLLVTVLSALVIGFWAEDFYRLWIGTSEIGEEGLQTVVLLLRVLLVSIFFEFVSGTAGQILLGAGRVRILAIIAAAQVVVNLVVTVALIPRLGLLGAAIGTVVAVFGARSIWTVILVSRQLSLRFSMFVRQVLVRPLVVGALFAASAHTIQRLGPAQTWTQLLTQGTLAGIVGLSIATLIGIDQGERHALVLKAREWLGRGS